MSASSEPPGSDRPAPLAPITIDRFSQLMGAIYDTAKDTENWSACLDQIRCEFAANYTSLIVRRASAHDLGYIISASGIRREVRVDNPYITMSPFSCLRPEKIVTTNDILSPEEWRASQYYQDWCKPHNVFHVMAVDIDIPDVGSYGLRMTRPPEDPPFSAADRLLCEKLVPHLKRALGLHASVNHDRQVFSLYRHAMGQLMVGVFVLDEHGLILESNAMATAIAQLGDGISISSKKLGATYPADNRKLQQLVQKVLDQREPANVVMAEAMSVSRPSGRAAWGLVAQAINSTEWTEGRHRPCVAVFVRDAEGKSEPPMRLAQQLFQLTPAETSLAIQLANGLSLDEASELLNIRRNTARAHLRSIFSKTGVRRQTELVRIFLNSVALLGNKE
ncbi:DNA-binding transcriptional regulator, CsgD family [Collimonas sp. OK607]|uniref:helix-turn-helix transcriptional regulator n=1 Tax=Collimonas sp. OK607 TaxID=1798194 RepID=UPI0008EF4AE0|nr:LuxR C-terminal-related transcriptional regulator [Collimonas sp. OK607]SFA82108.1 DNA-binding transcriptional regulator, CsgD family [Collimonas sp. OK607]